MPLNTSWKPPPDSLPLLESEVHVWRCDLPSSGDAHARWRSCLSAEELARADRFLRDGDRQQWLAARASLRLILGRYLQCPPAAIEFAANAYGRPQLSEVTALPAWQFNQSHSHELSLIAVTRGREVGVDVEFMRPGMARDDVAERFFAPGEAAQLRQLPAEARTRAFYDCWTRKEAFVKARGQGLSFPLNQFAVAFGPGETPRLVHLDGEPDAPRTWQIYALDPAPDYAAALVVSGGQCELRCWSAPSAAWLGVPAEAGSVSERPGPRPSPPARRKRGLAG